ncbi:B12-binding domain-containing radical SAM protein [bacterium]|nr:B12-binding domain-containing radical SAM protein [candidate division CSSED10-310 bacterium]
MKVILTRPWNTTSMLIPNHGLGYLATALRQAGHDPVIIDCIRDRLHADAFVRRVLHEAPGLIGFQVYTFDLPTLRPYIDALKPLNIPVVTGGPHPSAAPADMIRRFPDVPLLIRGEAESSLTILADAIARHGGIPGPELLETIPGLVTPTTTDPESRSCVLNPDLDSLGFPDWEQISPLSYPIAPQGTFTRRLPVAPIIVTRGCPYPCTFCAGKIISGRAIRTRSVSHVMDELHYLVNTFGIREFHIQDDNFTFDRDYVLAFCQALTNSGLDLVWSCPNGIRLDSLDSSVLHAMEHAGCYSVAVGIESGSQRILNLMRKQTALGDLIHKVREIRRVTRWEITGFFIIGYPGETREEMEATIRLSRRLPLDKANFGILMPLPGTGVEPVARAAGWNPDTDMLRMSEYRSPFTPAGITQRQMRWILTRAFVGFYARPRIIWRFIRRIQSPDQFRILCRRFIDVVKP